MMIHPRVLICCFAASLLGLSGCLSPRQSPAVQYYRLQPSDPAPEAVGTFDGKCLVGPVEVSPYLKRAHLARQTGEHGVSYREYDRWAEPLEWNLAMVVAADLRACLDTGDVRAYSSRLPGDPDGMHLTLRVYTFEVDQDGNASLLIGVHFPDGTLWRFSAEGPVEGEGAPAEVAALNRLVQQFSRALASEMLTRCGEGDV